MLLQMLFVQRRGLEPPFLGGVGCGKGQCAQGSAQTNAPVLASAGPAPLTCWTGKVSAPNPGLTGNCGSCDQE